MQTLIDSVETLPPETLEELSSLICDQNTAGELFGVEATTIAKWRERYPDFPAPNGSVGGRPWWWRHRLIVWGHMTGRIESHRRSG